MGTEALFFMKSMIKFYNTLTKKVDIFNSINSNKVTIYACGMTVYDDMHIGHARQAIFFDIIRNYFLHLGYKVNYVRNFTDIDDKIIKKANDKGCSFDFISSRYIEESIKDQKRLKIGLANYQPKVTEHIEEIINFIYILIKKGYAYCNNGEVFFNVNKFKDYGKLSRRKKEELRVCETSINKKNQSDFALWKSSKKGEPFWESPWGKGRPGWHIECSAIVKKYFGNTIDIHGGGIDLIFPHHENEIAQSESANDKPLANYWIHNGLVMINNQKMSKSLNNFITIKEILKKYHPDVIRFATLSFHYMSPINFSDALFSEVNKNVYSFYKTLNKVDKFLEKNDIKDFDDNKNNFLPECIANLKTKFNKDMDNNLNTAKVLANLFNVFSEINKTLDDERKNIKEIIYIIKIFKSKFYTISSILNILNENPEKFINNFKKKYLKNNNILLKEVNKKLVNRNTARMKRDYKTADRIREELKVYNIVIQDINGKTEWDILF